MQSKLVQTPRVCVLLLGAAFDFVLQQPFEELGVRPLPSDCLLLADIQRVEDAGQPELFELRGELMDYCHGVTACNVLPTRSAAGRANVVAVTGR